VAVAAVVAAVTTAPPANADLAPAAVLPTAAATTAVVADPTTSSMAVAVPNLPTVPNVPSVPNLPTVPSVPKLPSVPSVPDVPSVPQAPNLPTVPQTPTVPQVPNVPDLPNVPSVPSVPQLPTLPTVPQTPTVPQVPTVPTVPQTPQLPAGVGDPDAITEPLGLLELPGILTISNIDASGAPTASITSLPMRTGQADSNTDVGVLSTDGETLSAGYEFADTEAAAGGGGTGYACVNNSTNKYFHASRPITTNGSTKIAQYRWQFSPYTQYYARTVNGKDTWQEEICATGGADGQNGYRTLYNASVMAAQTTDSSARIGLQNDTGGGTTAQASLQISAQAGPVTISGSLPTGGGGSMYGQYGKPKYPSHADAYSGTESFAGWKAGCTYARWCGSSDMQNQVHHGLFEFFHGDYNKSFPLDAQFNYYCSGPYGQGCG
jgi:hypothetical protein